MTNKKIYQSIIKSFRKKNKKTLQFQGEVSGNIWDDKDLVMFESLTDRDAVFTDLVEDYVDNYNDEFQSKLFMKQSFFWITMISFALLIICAIAAIIICAVGLISGYIAIGVLVAAIIDLIMTVITLPRIIAVHLFPKKGDKAMNDMLTVILNHDIILHEGLVKRVSRDINKNIKKTEEKKNNFTNRMN